MPGNLLTALWVPVDAAPNVGDAIAVTAASPVATAFAPSAGGTTLPPPTKEGDVMQVSAALQWVAGAMNGATY